MDLIIQAIAAWMWLIIFATLIGIGTFGSFVHSRLKAKDRLKEKALEHRTEQAKINLQIQTSQEREAALKLRAIERDCGLPVSYNQALDDDDTVDPTPQLNPPKTGKLTKQ